MKTPRLHSMYWFAQMTTSAVSPPGGFMKRWIESVVSCRKVLGKNKAPSVSLELREGSDQERNLKVAPLSSRCDHVHSPPAVHWLSGHSGNSGRSFVHFRQWCSSTSADSTLKLSSRWQRKSTACAALGSRDGHEPDEMRTSATDWVSESESLSQLMDFISGNKELLVESQHGIVTAEELPKKEKLVLETS